MSLQEQINTDLIAATKSGDSGKVGVLRLLKNAFTNEQIKLRHELSEEELLKVLAREAKQRRDSIQAYRDGGREDLATEEEAELKIIETYLPLQISDEELEGIIASVIEELGSDVQLGRVIGGVMKRVASRADGGRVSDMVRKRIQP